MCNARLMLLGSKKCDDDNRVVKFHHGRSKFFFCRVGWKNWRDDWKNLPSPSNIQRNELEVEIRLGENVRVLRLIEIIDRRVIVDNRITHHLYDGDAHFLLINVRS